VVFFLRPRAEKDQMMKQIKTLNVAIVGGGPGCKAIMDMIFVEKLSQLRMKLIGVACTNPNAVGYSYAQEKGIYTTRDYRDLYKLKDLNMIIELTGRKDVADEIFRTKPEGVRLMGNVAARLFWDVFQIEEERIAERKRAEERLRKAHDELERGVEERTSELSKSNALLKLEITERKLLEKALKESEERLRNILDSIQAGILTIEAKSHKIVGVNPVAMEMIGAPKEKVLGKVCHRFVCRGQEGRCPITDLGQNVDNSETVLIGADGKTIPILKTAVAITLDGRKHLIESFLDITERKRAEEELRKINEELKNFVHVVSHDLKTPIISIQGFSSRLLKKYQEKLDERAISYLEQIQSSARRMELFVSDLLSLARIGQVVSTFDNVSSFEIVRDVVSRLQLRQKGKEIKLDILDILPTIWCDPERISQVFENLLVNAIKFMGDTENPKIEIGYEDSGDFHQFYVKDNGIGIDPKNQQTIFDMFQQVKEIEDKEGTGIGLAIVDRIVKSHGGEVWVGSEKGKGATFYFALPKAS
jgi:PAS domain S-box-containing protein